VTRLRRPARPPSPARRAAAALPGAAVLGAAVLAGACRQGGAAPRSVVEQAVALAPAIERATGLRFTAPPKVEVRTRAQVRAFVARALEEPGARAELAGLSAAYKRLGLVPDTLDLPALLGRVLDEQVAGYYDPRSKTLYVVQGVDSAVVSTTLRHELVHALQDQHRNLDSLLATRGQADRATAAQAALEGQATWAQVGGGADLTSRLAGGWDRVRAEIRENSERDPRLAAAPLVVREGLLFPYLSGAELARAVALGGHPDSVLLRLPLSSEQVLHAEAYAGRAPGSAPLAVGLPPLPGGAAANAENTLGEFDTRLVLFQHLEDLDRAARAAAGWGGDRWAVARAGGGEAFVWLTVWDGPVDAAEFYDAMGEAVAKRYPGARAAAAPNAPAGPRPGAARRGRGAAPAAPAAPAPEARTFAVDRAEGGPRQVTLRAGAVGGHPAVLYVDAPAAAGADFAGLVDLARATARVEARPAPGGR
jgi:hypothetical protein